MTVVHEYRAKAEYFLAKAECELDPLLRAQYQQLGQGYLRLTEQAERNQHSDIVYETPPAARPAQQQQRQQIQPGERETDDQA
jgi:hypothetical protein